MKNKYINFTNYIRPQNNIMGHLDIEVDNYLRTNNLTRTNEDDFKPPNKEPFSNIIKKNKTKIKNENEVDIFDDFEKKNKLLNEQIKNGKNEIINNNLFFVNNDLRTGSATRLTNATFKKQKEELIVDRFQYLTKNFQDPNKIVLPFERGGECTRKIKKSGAIIKK
jgi:hypothetical protein